MDEQERLRRKAERMTQKRRATAPLFAAAGLVPDVTVEDVQRREERLAAASVAYWARIEEQRQRFEERAQWLRAAVAAYAPHELAELDRRRSCLPSDGAYSADFWRCEWRRVRTNTTSAMCEKTEVSRTDVTHHNHNVSADMHVRNAGESGVSK